MLALYSAVTTAVKKDKYKLSSQLYTPQFRNTDPETLAASSRYVSQIIKEGKGSWMFIRVDKNSKSFLKNVFGRCLIKDNFCMVFTKYYSI